MAWLLSHTIRRERPHRFPTPEELQLKQARKESEKVRVETRQTLEQLRERQHWLERALIPYEGDERSLEG